VKTRSTFEALDTTVGDVAEVPAQDGLTADLFSKDFCE
jgi:hypothetical protein